GNRGAQPVANASLAPPRERLELGETVATGCHRLPLGSHGKKGVDGSSPSEGSAKAPLTGLFVCVQSVHGPLRAWMEPFMELSRRERALMRPDVPREWRAVAVSPRSL